MDSKLLIAARAAWYENGSGLDWETLTKDWVAIAREAGKAVGRSVALKTDGERNFIRLEAKDGTVFVLGCDDVRTHRNDLLEA